MKTTRVYGFHTLLSACKQADVQWVQLWVDQARDDQRMQTLLQQCPADTIHHLSRAELDELVGGSVVHQGVVAEIILPQCGLWADEYACIQAIKDDPQKSWLFLILDGVQDPHNLGACLRTAEAMGVDAVFIPRDRSASLNPTVRRVACGAAERISVITVVNCTRWIKQLQQLGVWVYGADMDGAQTIDQCDWSGSIALVMGSEGQGLRHLTKTSCDVIAAIPLSGFVSSLNVSVATGMVLYEVDRQRRLQSS